MIKELDPEESLLLKYYRGFLILIIVFGHVGGFWFYDPYSRFLLVVNALFFFISGSVAILSYTKCGNYKTYILNRYISLLIPYYLLCLISLLIYFFNNSSMPDFNPDYLLKWLTMRPSNQMMPFPIGQIWWLQTLLLIILWAPVLFWLDSKNVKYNWLIIILCLFLSTVQLLSVERIEFYFLGFDFYTPVFYTTFFIFGLFYTTRKAYFTKSFLMIYGILGLSGCVILVYTLSLDINYDPHCFPPDLYYASGTLFVIGITLLTKKYFMKIVGRYKLISFSLDFFYKHTFSIFLLHTFSIYFCENYLWFILPKEKNILYALIKFPSVLLITCLITIPFTTVSKRITNWTLSFIRH